MNFVEQQASFLIIFPQAKTSFTEVTLFVHSLKIAFLVFRTAFFEKKALNRIIPKRNITQKLNHAGADFFVFMFFKLNLNLEKRLVRSYTIYVKMVPGGCSLQKYIPNDR